MSCDMLCALTPSRGGYGRRRKEAASRVSHASKSIYTIDNCLRATRSSELWQTLRVAEMTASLGQFIEERFPYLLLVFLQQKMK